MNPYLMVVPPDSNCCSTIALTFYEFRSFLNALFMMVLALSWKTIRENTSFYLSLSKSMRMADRARLRRVFSRSLSPKFGSYFRREFMEPEVSKHTTALMGRVL